jgi:hypothetical protein
VSNRIKLLRRLAVLAAALCLIACTDDTGSDDSDPQTCVEIDYEGCALLYPPSWDQVWDQTINTTCSGGGAACHSGQFGVIFTDQTSAYTSLTTGEHAQIIPGDPACSPLMHRLESDDPSFRMPPGNTALPAGARCSIATWIANGASQN